MSASTEFAANLPFLFYQQRNAVLDNVVYDTASLSVDEKAKLSPLADREVSIIVVPPSNSDRPIRHYKHPLRFMTKEGPTIRAIAVAGAGSSALGTAALARNVADALDTDVAGIVASYGLSEVMTDALGGWFAFGAADRIRFAMEAWLERMRPSLPADAGALPGDDTVVTLSEILLAAPPQLEYLVTHGRGSLIASHALEHYVADLDDGDRPLFERLHITTLGAVVGVPQAFRNVKQYLGALDWFGRVNSRAGVRHEPVPGAGHHLNPGLPYHLSVAAVLKAGNGTAPRLLPKPAPEERLAPFPLPAEVKAKAEAPVRRPLRMAETRAKDTPRPAAPAAKAAPEPMASREPKAAPAPKAAAPAPKAAAPAPKAAAPASKAAAPASKAAAPAPAAMKDEVAAGKPPLKSVTKNGVKTVPRPTKAPKAGKSVAANGKLTLKKGKAGR